MNKIIPARIVYTQNPSLCPPKGFLFWTANRMIALHTVLAMLAIAWSLLIREWLQAIVIAGLWLIAFRLWIEWKVEEATAEPAQDIDLNENR